MPDSILKCYRKYIHQLHDRLKKKKKNKNELQENESSEFHFVSHLFPTNLSHLVPLCKYKQHSCNIYNMRISSTSCIYLLCKIIPLKTDYCLKSLNRLVFVMQNQLAVCGAGSDFPCAVCVRALFHVNMNLEFLKCLDNASVYNKCVLGIENISY